VHSALVVLLILMALTPAIWLADGPITFAAAALIVASSLGLIAYTVSERELEHLTKVLRLPLLLAAVPAIWMLAQLAPLPLTVLSHPVWKSATEALRTPVAGHISVDLGATLIGFLKYLTAVGIFLSAAALAVDRTRAEWLFNCLVGATSAFALILAAHSASLLQVDSANLVALHSATALGTIVTGAAVIRSIERYQPPRSQPKVTYSRLAYSLAISSTAFAFCWLLLIVSAPISIIFSASLGTLIMLLVALIRRLFLGPLTGSALAMAVVATVVAIAISGVNAPPGDPTLRFASGVPPTSVSVAERMMLDNGSGAGAATYQALLPIYRFSSEIMAPDLAPTTAAAITIEMGRAALWIFVVLGLILACLLFLGALKRGRDSFYASAAAGCVVALVAQSFVNAGLLLPELGILAACVLGIGVTQSMSRSLHRG
jgi:hypothetical protein